MIQNQQQKQNILLILHNPKKDLLHNLEKDFLNNQEKVYTIKKATVF